MATKVQESLFYKVCDAFIAEYPMLKQGIFGGAKEADYKLIPFSSRVLSGYFKKHNNDQGNLQHGLDALAHMTFDFIRLQSRFQKTRKYHNDSNSNFIKEFYYNLHRMEGYYLDGLLLSYALWPNHLRIYYFYIKEFLTQLNKTVEIFEIGTGHGLMALTALEDLPDAKYSGIDLSPYSISYARDLLIKNDICQDQITLNLADGCIDNFLYDLDKPESGWHAALCCEVFEHVQDPKLLRQALYSSLTIGGKAFITTVANIEAEDHLFLFENKEQIRSFLTEGGFLIEKELILPLRNFAIPELLPLNYAAIIRKV